MSVVGYFSKYHATRMPRNPNGIEHLGIRWHGRVLQGEKSLMEALADDATTARLSSNPNHISQPGKSHQCLGCE